MNTTAWTEVDRYLVERTHASDSVLEAVLAANAAAGLPAIDVSAAQGRMLTLLARMGGARRILEIGTLGGYSSICLARALPDDGRLLTLEAMPAHAEVAAANLERAGLAGRVDIRLGNALDILPQLESEDAGPFDLVFVDADKASNAEYLDWALKLARPGATLIVDNVVRDGGVLDADSDDPGVRGTRRMFDRIAAEPRLSATAIQTVGAKGWDGFLLALVE